MTGILNKEIIQPGNLMIVILRMVQRFECVDVVEIS
jgi:hypothetical protein